MLGKGFTAVGLSEILGAAGVPKGSFYHYFESKEVYGVALLERFFTHYLATIDNIVADNSLNGRSKLATYFSRYASDSSETNCVSRCLVVKLTGEVSDLSAPMRTTLERGISSIIERLAACIIIGRADRSISSGAPADMLAASLYQLWLGAALVAKTQPHSSAYEAAQLATNALLA